jgi:DedD protein
MPVFSFLKRNQNTAATATVDEAATVQEARSRARHRLMGAVVLVVAGIIAFPLLFESQPRPLAVDIPIEMPAKRDLVPLPMPAPAAAGPARSSAPVITEKAAEALPAEPAEATPPSVSAAAAVKPQQAASMPAPNSAAERAVAVAPPVPPAAAAERSAEAKRAQALLDGNDTALASHAPVAASGADAAPPRFVVQAGAYGDASSLRDARQKVERLGLKTYTQVVQTETGTRTRVRVGPFATRGEAEKAAQRIKGSGLAVNILAL